MILRWNLTWYNVFHLFPLKVILWERVQIKPITIHNGSNTLVNREKVYVIDSFFLSKSLSNESCLISLMLPNESFLVLKTHLQPMAFAPLGNSTRFQTPLLYMEFISSFMASYHKFDSLQLMAWSKVLGLFLALTL